jgi:peroxiredoxin
MVAVGDAAPDFTLKDQHGQEVSLSDFRGVKNVVVMFYPLAFTGVCQGELCSIRDDLASFQNDSVQVLAISVDSVFSHKEWAAQQGYEFPLLADFWPHGAVAQAYGVFVEQAGLAKRGTFVVDKVGVLRWSVVNAIPDARNQGDYLEALAAL